MCNIILKGIIDEDFVNYKLPSMTLMFPRCTLKCGADFCHNSGLINDNDISIDVDKLCERYINNPITEAVVCQGLEPFDTFAELYCLIVKLRTKFNCSDAVVIYTGYDKEEILDKISLLSQYKNIIIKFGRYVSGDEQHLDQTLGVKLASDNQYAEQIS